MVSRWVMIRLRPAVGCCCGRGMLRRLVAMLVGRISGTRLVNKVSRVAEQQPLVMMQAVGGQLDGPSRFDRARVLQAAIQTHARHRVGNGPAALDFILVFPCCRSVPPVGICHRCKRRAGLDGLYHPLQRLTQRYKRRIFWFPCRCSPCTLR